MKSLNISLFKKQQKLTECHLKFLEIGIVMVLSQLSDLQIISECLALKILRMHSTLIEMMIKKNDIFIAESVQINKKMILLDKENFSNECIRNTILLRMLVQVLTLKEKEYKPFWNNQCSEISKRLWLPTKTDLQDLDTNSSNQSLIKEEERSQLLTMKNSKVANKNSPKICLQSSISSTADKWEKGDTVLKNHKVKLYFNKDQKKILKEWFGTYRYLYNFCLNYSQQKYKSSITLEHLFNEYHHLNFQDMRNMFVTKKGNEDFIPEWQFNTPKEVRVEAIKELITNIKTNIGKLKNNTITKFSMKFKYKKQNTQSITIPKSAIKFKDQKAYIYPTILKDSIKIGRRTLKKHKKKFKKFKNLDFNIEHDCKLCFNGFEYYLLIPIDKLVQTKKDENKILAFDPGEKTFQTAYSENEIIESNINKKKKEKLENKIKLLQSLSAKKEIKLNKKKFLNLHKKIKNLVDDMHWKLITYVKKKYNDILIPNFESQKIVKKMSFGLKKVKNNLLSFCHYKFRMRLIEKTKELRNFRVYTVREDYTSKTCTNCGSIKDIKNERIYNCEKCNLTIGRDINAARNIFLRYCALL